MSEGVKLQSNERRRVNHSKRRREGRGRNTGEEERKQKADAKKKGKREGQEDHNDDGEDMDAHYSDCNYSDDFYDDIDKCSDDGYEDEMGEVYRRSFGGMQALVAPIDQTCVLPLHVSQSELLLVMWGRGASCSSVAIAPIERYLATRTKSSRGSALPSAQEAVQPRYGRNLRDDAIRGEGDESNQGNGKVHTPEVNGQYAPEE